MRVSETFSRDLKIQKLNYKEDFEIDFEKIKAHLSNLKKVDLKSLTTDDSKKAFWINVYNGMTNYLIIKLGIKKQMKEYRGIFSKPKLNIGSYRFSLDQIEHGILRINKRHGIKLRKPFSILDPRRRHLLKNFDHRIHFALNCGATSCPPIAFYSAEHIDDQLKLAEENFIENNFIVNDQKKEISHSSILYWYKSDFKGIYLNDPKFKKYKFSPIEYDWSI